VLNIQILNFSGWFPMETLQNSSPNILVVEDSLDAQKIITCVLKSGGFTVQVAGDGVEALQILQAWMPDVILTDIMMPRMDGLELLTRIKEQERFAHLPVIVMTTSQRGAERAEEAGALLVLRKPFEFSGLMTTLRKLIDGTAAFAVALSLPDEE
jgi:chemosensory pili system protein ChpA (sensor histidine kinase/response regulator)